MQSVDVERHAPTVWKSVFDLQLRQLIRLTLKSTNEIATHSHTVWNM